MDEAGSEEARGRRGRGRDEGCTGKRRPGRRAPAVGPAPAQMRRCTRVREEEAAAGARRPEVLGSEEEADDEGECVGGGSAHLDAARRRATVEDEGGWQRRRMREASSEERARARSVAANVVDRAGRRMSHPIYKEHKSSNHICATIKSRIYTTESSRYHNIYHV
jgi:hypothetical protein